MKATVTAHIAPAGATPVLTALVALDAQARIVSVDLKAIPGAEPEAAALAAFALGQLAAQNGGPADA